MHIILVLLTNVVSSRRCVFRDACSLSIAPRLEARRGTGEGTEHDIARFLYPSNKTISRLKEEINL